MPNDQTSEQKQQTSKFLQRFSWCDLSLMATKRVTSVCLYARQIDSAIPHSNDTKCVEAHLADTLLLTLTARIKKMFHKPWWCFHSRHDFCYEKAPCRALNHYKAGLIFPETVFLVRNQIPRTFPAFSLSFLFWFDIFFLFLFFVFLHVLSVSFSSRL